MKITSRSLAAFAFLCSFTQLGAAPLLFVNYNSNNFGQTRAAELGLDFQTIGDFTSVSQLAGKSVVIMPGTTNYANLLSQTSILHDFVQSGGYLWLNIAGGTCVSDFAPGGVDFAQYTCGGTYNQSETVANSSHPYIQGSFHPNATQLTEGDFSNWNVTDLGHLVGLPGNAAVITQNPQGATLAEYSYGQGWVVLSTLTYGWGDAGAKGAPLNNMLYYAANQIRGSEAASVATPEPASMLLTAGGLLLGCTFLRRRR
jgi:hypothetical protein